MGGSLSDTSINQQFAEYAGRQLKGVKLNIVKLNDFYPLPIYMPQLEENGTPANAHRFHKEIH
jgi:NAD(P)H-dependent FMN reductase